MLLRNIKLRNYPGFTKIDLDFSKTNVLLICDDVFQSTIDDMSDLFIFLLMLAHHDSHSYMKSNLTDDITTISIEFTTEDGEEYYYYLQISKLGIHAEELYKNDNIIYQAESTPITKNPTLPNPVRQFIQSFIIMDLNKEFWLKDLLDEAINKCNSDKEYYEIMTSIMKNFNFLEAENNLRCVGDDVYIYGRSVRESNYTVKVVFSLLPLFIECIGTQSVMFLHGFDIDIDMKSKLNLLNLFVNKGINDNNSQLLFTDKTSYQEYDLMLSFYSKCILTQDYNKNYILTNQKNDT